MALVVWKFRLDFGGFGNPLEFDVPGGAQILSVQMQAPMPCIWFLVDPMREKVARKFQVVGTGHDEVPGGS